MAFQAGELPARTEAELGLSPPRGRRVVTGRSNGGAFAIAAGLQRPDLFGHVLAFSVAGRPPPPDLQPAKEPASSFHLVAGHDPALWDIAFLTCLHDLAAR